MHVAETLPQCLSGSGRGNSSIYNAGLPVGWCAQKGVPNSATSAPKLADFLVHLFRVGQDWHTFGVYHSAISTF